MEAVVEAVMVDMNERFIREDCCWPGCWNFKILKTTYVHVISKFSPYLMIIGGRGGRRLECTMHRPHHRRRCGRRQSVVGSVLVMMLLLITSATSSTIGTHSEHAMLHCRDHTSRSLTHRGISPGHLSHRGRVG